jgi:hypothetical protein
MTGPVSGSRSPVTPAAVAERLRLCREGPPSAAARSKRFGARADDDEELDDEDMVLDSLSRFPL